MLPRKFASTCLLLALTISCTGMVRIAQAQAAAAAASPDTTSADAAKKVADELVASFADNQGALAELRSQATYLLEALGGSDSLGASPSATNGTTSLGSLTPEQLSAMEAAIKALGSMQSSKEGSDQSAALIDQLRSVMASPAVTASTGPAASGPIGSGENLLQFRERVQAVKEQYAEARTYLGIDDAVKIGGYIRTLENLGLDFVAAFPLAELSLFATNVALGSAITSLLGGIFYLVGSVLAFPPAIAGLDSALNDAQALGLRSTDGGAVPPPSSQLQGLIDNQALVDNLITSTADFGDQVLPWVLGGGAAPIMGLATSIVSATSDSITRLEQWSPPVGLDDVFRSLGATAASVVGK